MTLARKATAHSAMSGAGTINKNKGDNTIKVLADYKKWLDLPSEEYDLVHKSLTASASIKVLTLHNRPMSNPQSPALKAAIDAFSLAQAALVLGDARFAAASVRRYVVGVAALRSALSRLQDSNRDEMILAMLIFQLLEVRQLVAENQRSSADITADHETDFARRGLGGAHCRRSEVCRNPWPMETL